MNMPQNDHSVMLNGVKHLGSIEIRLPGTEILRCAQEDNVAWLVH